MSASLASCRDAGLVTLQSYLPDYSFSYFTDHVKTYLRKTNRQSQCLADIQQITASIAASGVAPPDTQAFSLRNAWAAPPGVSYTGDDAVNRFSGSVGISGFHSGNFFAPGSRLDCYSAATPNISTAYCRTNYVLASPIVLGLSGGRHRNWMQGICIPRSCADDSSLKSFKGNASAADNFFPDDFLYTDPVQGQCDLQPFIQCEPDNTWVERCDSQDGYCWAGFSFLTIFVALCVFASFVYCLMVGFKPKYQVATTPAKETKNPSTLRTINNYFALQSTWKDVVRFKRNPKTLDSFNGMRVLAIVWIITLHIQVLVQFPLWDGTWYLKNLAWFAGNKANKWGYYFVGRGEPAVDTFFAMGGFLAAQILYRKMKGMEKECGVGYNALGRVLYCLNLVLHRWLRFAPVIFFLMCWTWVLPIGSNSFSSQIVRQLSTVCHSDSTAASWWGLLFMIQTWAPGAGGGACSGWMWYVVDEFWYYCLLVCITASFVYIESANNRTKKYGKVMIFLLYATLITLSPIYKTALNATCPVNQNNTASICSSSQAKDLYFTPWCRCSAYFIGALSGFLLKDKRYFIKLSKSWHYLMYFFSWIICAGGLTMIIMLLKESYNWPTGGAAYVIYDSFKREVWAVFIVLSIVLCEYVAPFTNNFPVWFLSHRFWWLPARINYATYAVHYTVLAMVMSMLSQPLILTYNVWFEAVVLCTLWSYFAGFWIYSICESPFAKLEERFINQKMKTYLKSLYSKDD